MILHSLPSSPTRLPDGSVGPMGCIHSVTESLESRFAYSELFRSRQFAKCRSIRGTLSSARSTPCSPPYPDNQPFSASRQKNGAGRASGETISAEFPSFRDDKTGKRKIWESDTLPGKSGCFFIRTAGERVARPDAFVDGKEGACAHGLCVYGSPRVTKSLLLNRLSARCGPPGFFPDIVNVLQGVPHEAAPRPTVVKGSDHGYRYSQVVQPCQGLRVHRA